MAHNLDKVTNKVPKGYWRTLRAYDKTLHDESLNNAASIPAEQPGARDLAEQSDTPVIGWQWQTENMYGSEESIFSRPVHCKWWAGPRRLGGLILRSGLRVTEVMIDPEVPMAEQETWPGVSKIFTYTIAPKLLSIAHLAPTSHVGVSTAIHANVRDSKLWDEETKDAMLTTVAEARATPGADLLDPSPEDYGLLLRHIEFGVEIDGRRPFSPEG